MISLDRGPGAGANLQDERMLVPWRELVASYAPQDKATVESSHPRTKETEGKPQAFESALTLIEAVKDEIVKVGKDNWGSNASERLTPEMINAGVLPNPMSIWNWLDKRGRTSAESIDFARAVRTFLSPVEFNATRDSLKLHARHFVVSNGDARFHRSLPRGQTVSVDGYAMNLCVRHAWITESNRLIEVSARLPIRDCDEQLYSSIEELVKEEQRLRSLNTEQRKLTVAAEVGYQHEVEKETGKAPKSGRWVSGQQSRPSKSQAEKAAQDAATMPGGNR